jgi:hypothetical protein
MKKLFILICIILPGIMYGQGMHSRRVAASGGGDSYGPELITDGDFSSGTNWTPGSGAWTIGSGTASYDNTGNSNLTQADGDMAGSIEGSTDYLLSFDIDITSGTAYFQCFNFNNTVTYLAYDTYADGHHEVPFTTDADVGLAGFVIRATTSSSNAFDLDNVSIKEVL